MKMRGLPFLTFFLCFITSVAFSQTDNFLRFGIGVEAGLNSHSAQFAQIPGFVAMPVDLIGGTGFGYSLGINTDARIGNGFRAGLSVGYDVQDAVLSGNEPTVFTVNGIAVAGTIRHYLLAKLPSAIIRPSLIFGIGNCEISTGLTFARYVNPIFEIRQEVIEPQGITLTSKPFGGSLPIGGGISLSPSIAASIRYSWGNITLLPTARMELGVSDIAGLPWRTSTFRAGIISRFIPVQHTPPAVEPIFVPDTIYKRDTIASEIRGIKFERVILLSKSAANELLDGGRRTIISESYRREIPRSEPLLRAQASVSFIRADGKQSERLQVETRHVITKRFFPVLPIIFFEEGSSDIPARYFEFTSDNPLAYYYQAIDTIAIRLAAKPAATLVLTVLLRGNTLDSIRKIRAERLRNILLKRAEIQEKQLQIRTEAARPVIGLPLDETESIKLTSGDAGILAPQIFYDTTITADPPEARFFPNVISDAGIASWQLQISLDGKIVKEFSGKDEPPASISWQLAEEKTVLRIRKPLYYRLTAINYSGDTVVSPDGEIRFMADNSIAYKTGEMFDAIEYSIVFFDYNSSDISTRDRTLLERIKPYCIAGKTFIAGMTDSLGNKQYNKRLSQKRAESAAQILGLERSAAQGLGADGAEFPGNLPEGRMFNRRVKVSVQR